MNPRITPEQREAIDQNRGRPVVLESDDQTHRVFVLVEQATFERAMRALAEQEDLESIRRGIDEMEAGLGRPLSEVDDDIRRDFGFRART